MAREGQHSATLTVKGNSRSANRDLQALAQRQHKFERSIEQTNIALDKQARKQAKAANAGKGMRGSIGGMTTALSSAGGYVAAAAAAIAITEQFSARVIDNVNVMTDLRFNMEEVVAAMDNMTTQHEAAGGAAMLQSSSLKLTQVEMNKLANLTATVADKNKKDLVTSWDAVAKAISKGNVDRLRALGLQTDNAKLLDEVARATGRSTTQIGLAERQQIAYNEALRALNEQAKIAGESQDGLAFSFERAKNKTIDAFDAIGRWINGLPADFREFGEEMHRSIEGTFVDMGMSAEAAAEAMESIETGIGVVLRAGTALITFGMSELIPFLMDWEKHLKTINGLMGNMPQMKVSREGLGPVGAAISGIGDMDFMDPTGPNGFTRATRSLMQGANDAQAALAKLADEAAKNADRHRGGRRRRPSAESLDRGFEGPTAVDSDEQIRRLDTLQDAEMQHLEAVERRHAEVIALRENSDRALREADERARLREAEVAIERAQRDQDEAALIHAKDERDQAMHDRNLRRMEEEQEARIRNEQTIRELREAGIDSAEALRMTREGEVHDLEALRMARQAEIAEQERLVESRRQLAAVMSSTASSMNGIALNSSEIGKLAANEAIKGEERKARFMQRMAGAQAISIGVLETVKAAAAFASFNPIQGAMHASAAALAFTRGGLLMRGNVEGFASGGGGSVGGGAASAPQQQAKSNHHSGTTDTPVPVSQQATFIGDPISRDNPPVRRNPEGATVIHFHAAMVTPETVEMVTRVQRDQARGRGIRVGA